ncbi:O-antigen ligase family protein [Streptacidiphilus monticola]
MLAILLPFAIQQALDPIRRHRSLFVRWAPVALIGGALPLTVSKTSIIGAAIVVLIMVPRWKPQRRWAAIGVLLAGVAALKVAVPGLIGTLTGAFSSFFGAQDTSTQARTVKYAEIWPYIVQRPWFGRGSAPSTRRPTSSPTTSTCSPRRRWGCSDCWRCSCSSSPASTRAARSAAWPSASRTASSARPSSRRPPWPW